MKTVRTRIAPSPTGEDLHIGNAYTALINYMFAKKHGGQFIVRIEDTDRTRLVEGSERRILSSLSWLGIFPDEGPDKGGPFEPYRQSERLSLYKKYAEELVAKGHAYYCFCTQDRLEEMRKHQEENHQAPMYDGTCRKLDKGEAKARTEKGQKYVIRLRVPENGTTLFHDLVRGDISFKNELIDDQVLLKSDGYPTYHLGVVVDDHLMKISHIIRGEEWISSTPKHVLLYQFFGWEPPVFAHMPLLRNPDKSKLSKRRNPVWVSWYKEQGFLPEAMLNYLGTMAWAFPGGREKFTVDEMMKVFDLKDIQTTAPVFDIEKLKWLNKRYLMETSPQRFSTLISGASIYRGYPNFQEITKSTASLFQSRASTVAEYDSLAGFLYECPRTYEKPLRKQWLQLLIGFLEQASWEKEYLEKGIRTTAESHGIKPGDLFMALRIAVTGKTVGPPLVESIIADPPLGQKKTVERLKTALKAS